MPSTGGAREDSWSGAVLDNRFHVMRPLGSGGMAEVYLAQDRRLGRHVAVKILRSDVNAEMNVGRRLLQEARTIARLVHPHVVSVYDVGTEKGAVYIVMELLVGRSVGDLLSVGHSLRVDFVLEVARQIASALGAAHELGVVHRDVKPDNLFLVDSVTGVLAKLLDFSVARVGPSEDTMRLVRKGITFGTPHYMAPEQSRPHEVTPATDIYSLGCVCFEMLTGQVPYDDYSPIDILRKHRGAKIPLVSDLRRSLPIGLSELLAEMMAKDPQRRPRSALEVSTRMSAMLDAIKEQRIRDVPGNFDAQKTGSYGRKARRTPSVGIAKSDSQTRSLARDAAEARRKIESGRIGKGKE